MLLVEPQDSNEVYCCLIASLAVSHDGGSALYVCTRFLRRPFCSFPTESRAGPKCSNEAKRKVLLMVPQTNGMTNEPCHFRVIGKSCAKRESQVRETRRTIAQKRNETFQIYYSSSSRPLSSLRIIGTLEKQVLASIRDTF